MRRTKQVESIESYLSDLDRCLLLEGVDPKVRLDYVEQVADQVLTMGADPVEEFGPAPVYAVDLASSLGSRPRRPRLRALAAGLGLGAMFVAAMAARWVIDDWRDDQFDLPYEISWSDVVVTFGVLVALFWALLTHSGSGSEAKSRINRAVLELVAMVAFVWILALSVEGSFELDPSRSTTYLLFAALFGGVGLFWWSGVPRLSWALLTVATRPNSSMSYNPFGKPTVSLNRRVYRTELPPPPSSAENEIQTN